MLLHYYSIIAYYNLVPICIQIILFSIIHQLLVRYAFDLVYQ